MKTTLIEASRKFVFNVADAPLTTKHGGYNITLAPTRVTVRIEGDHIYMIAVRGITQRRDRKRGCAHDAVWTSGDDWQHLPPWLRELACGTGFPLEERRRAR